MGAVSCIYNKLKLSTIRFTAISLIALILGGCATYYQQSMSFQQDFAKGDLDKAQSFLEHHKKAAEKKDRLLYFLDRGVVEQMLGNYIESNNYFEKAYLFSQDYRKNFSSDLVEYVANPMLKPYVGEQFELILLHFYKAMNYLQLSQLDEALVEVRRVNVKLNMLNDKYEGKRNRYKEDAFAHNLMGIIYEAKGDVNNAFIAYRNAYNVYENYYDTLFQTSVPEQLKVDLVRTAALNGFNAEQELYEDKFNLKYTPEEYLKSELIFFWLNGLGPVKSEFSLNLTAVKGQGGAVTFANDQEGFTVPYFSSSSNNSSGTELGDLKVVRIAIPKYLKREPLISEAYLNIDGSSYALQKAENINAIAISTLQDRMFREISKAIGRLAVKQASELALREQNDDLGALLSAINAATEKADTRNWQTLPHSIYYQRLPLNSDSAGVQLITNGNQIIEDTLSFNIKSRPGETVFRMYHSLESTAPVEQ